jgi:hypothetical protein
MKKILLVSIVALVGCGSPLTEGTPKTENLLYKTDYLAAKEKALERAKLRAKSKKVRASHGHGTIYTRGYYNSVDSSHLKYYQKHGISPH